MYTIKSSLQLLHSLIGLCGTSSGIVSGRHTQVLLVPFKRQEYYHVNCHRHQQHARDNSKKLKSKTSVKGWTQADNVTYCSRTATVSYMLVVVTDILVK